MKKISSEISINSNILKAKWGTIDKKNPSSIYLEMGTYITPKEKQEDYSDKIKEINKEGKQLVKTALLNTDGVKSDFIFVTDVADTRITYGKKSYISFQIHIGRTRSELEKKIPFKEVVSQIGNKWTPVYDGIIDALESNGFSCSKTKK